jgi:transcriptional regulator with XRE-family HTH domain
LDVIVCAVGRTFGQNVKEMRDKRDLTQEVLASRLKLKRPAQISLVESGSTVPKPATVVKYARALECRTSELLHEVETDYDRLRADLPIRIAKSRAPTGESSVKRKRTG